MTKSHKLFNKHIIFSHAISNFRIPQKMLRLSLLLSLIFLFSCKKEKQTTTDESVGFTQLDNKEIGVNFENKVEDQENFNVLSFRNYYNGGGVAIGDVNNDGLKDIYFTANMTDNKLYLNKGKEGSSSIQFEDITNTAGVKGKKSWCTGVTMADVNADGFLDIYVCYSGGVLKDNKENELFINNGDVKSPKFTERAKEYGLNDAGSTTHASFFDYDLDGDLDCYVLNDSYKSPEKIMLDARGKFDKTAEGGDRLYRNDDGKFVNVTENSGIYSSNVGFGLGISVGDLNGDFYPDIYISNDFWERDYLYMNQKNGTFKEILPEKIDYTSLASMGSDIADINNDGHLDIFSTDMLPPDNYRLKAAMKFDDYYLGELRFRNSFHYQNVQNCLQVNQGDGTFQETAFFSGVAATDWSWGALIFDMNLDGQKDLFVSNGVYNDITDSDFVDFIADPNEIKKIIEEKGKYDFRDFVKYLPHNKRKNYAFINQGNQNGKVLHFENLASNLNLDQEGYSNGSAYGDLDNDGDFDLVVNNVNMPAFIYQNNSVEEKKNAFVKFKLEGSEKNKFGIGSTVMIYQKGKVQIAQSMSARGFESSVDSDIIFGLANNPVIDSVRIVWTDLKTQLIKNVKGNITQTLNYKNATELYKPVIFQAQTTFKEISNQIIADATHVENKYIDFDSDRLMPHVLSTEGPKLVKGDVNKDGKEDFILLGAKEGTDKLFLNTGAKFVESKQKFFATKNLADHISGALFDSDKDGDLDFLVGTGGNEYRDGVNAFTAIFYENNGKGDFTRQDMKAPQIKGQIGCIKPCDYDKDGDIDLFAGGKAVPGGYGLTPRSFLFQNDGTGKFLDVTNEFIGPLGMITDAIWTDINGDALTDLMVVGEWMPVTVFVNENGDFGKPLTIPNSEGWWNTIKASDIDKDGDMDFLLGNWGQNIKLKASLEKPLNLYVYDFDQNKRPEIVMEWFTQEDKIPYPFASKADLTAQMPSLKKTSLKYQEFAKKQVKDLFDNAMLDKALKKRVTNFASSVLINKKGDLVLEPLQDEAQMAPIFTFETGDFDNDGILDYFAGGNFFKLKPEMGRNEAFHGGYFKGIGKGKFNYISPQKSNINIRGEVRDATWIDKKLIVARNNDSVLIFEK
jgi:enediyne biosynthesis protein E4